MNVEKKIINFICLYKIIHYYIIKKIILQIMIVWIIFYLGTVANTENQ